MTEKEFAKLSIENRINKLSNNGKENQKVIQKLRRKLRSLDK